MYGYYQTPYYQNYNQQTLQNMQQMNQQQYTPQMNSMQTVQNSVQNDERIWVQGEESAKAYLVAPNSFVRLWDSTEQVFYEKRADQTGKPYMETYEYKVRGSNLPNVGVKKEPDYMAEINELKKRLDLLERGGVDVKQSNTDDSTV